MKMRQLHFLLTLKYSIKNYNLLAKSGVRSVSHKLVMESFQTRFCVVDKHTRAVPVQSAYMPGNEKFTQKGLFTHLVLSDACA